MQWRNRLLEAYKMGLDHGNNHGYTQKVYNPPNIDAYDDFKTAFINGYRQGYDNGVKANQNEQLPLGKLVFKGVK